MAPPGELRVEAGVVCWQVKLCDPHLSALDVRFSRRGAIQIYVYLYLYLIVRQFVGLTSLILQLYIICYELTVDECNTFLVVIAST